MCLAATNPENCMKTPLTCRSVALKLELGLQSWIGRNGTKETFATA